MKKHINKFLNTNFFFFFACTFFVIFMLKSCLQDTDLFWHLKIGEEIVCSRNISMADSFSWQTGLIWYQQEWLFDIIIYLVSIPFDGYLFDILYVINASLILSSGLFFHKPSCRILYYVFACYLYVSVSANRGNRPSEFSVWIVFFLIFIINQEIDVKWKCLSLFLGGLFLTNFHGAALIPTIGFLLVLTAVRVFMIIRMGECKSTICHTILPLFSFCIGALFCPSGLSLPRYLLANTFDESTFFIPEWQPWSPNVLGSVGIVLVLISLGYCLAKQGLSKDILLQGSVIIAAFCLSMLTAKGGPYFTIFSLVYGYPYVEHFVESMIGNFRILNKIEYGTYAIVLAYCILMNITHPHTFFFELPQKYCSQEIIATLQSVCQEDDFSILNNYTDGNYLIWNDIPCFIDSRQVPYTKSLSSNSSVNDYLSLFQKRYEKESYDLFFAKYNFKYVWETKLWYLTDYLLQRNDYVLIIDDTEKGQKLWKYVG